MSFLQKRTRSRTPEPCFYSSKNGRGGAQAEPSDDEARAAGDGLESKDRE